MQVARNLFQYRELIAILAWKQIVVRYKQAYMGVLWAMLKPLTLMGVFSLLNGFVGIATGGVPYPLVSFAALIPWVFFQESTSEGVGSIVFNAPLIRKIYFPREVFPLTGVVTKLVELVINLVVLAGLMAWFQVGAGATLLWVPLIVLYTVLAAMTIALAGAAFNVFYRDVGAMLPLLLQLMMYASPVIYPMALVRRKLLDEQAAGPWSDLLYTVYTMNPLAGIIDAFQRAVLYGLSPDWATLWPGALVVMVLLPLSYVAFKRAERHFADIV